MCGTCCKPRRFLYMDWKASIVEMSDLTATQLEGKHCKSAGKVPDLTAIQKGGALGRQALLKCLICLPYREEEQLKGKHFKSA